MPSDSIGSIAGDRHCSIGTIEGPLLYPRRLRYGGGGEAPQLLGAVYCRPFAREARRTSIKTRAERCFTRANIEIGAKYGSEKQVKYTPGRFQCKSWVFIAMVLLWSSVLVGAE